MMKFGDTLARVRGFYATRFEPEGVRVLADLYWRSLISVAGVLVVLALGYGTWDLIGVLETLAQTPDTSPPPPAALNRATLKSVVQRFDARRAAFADFAATEQPAVPDPGK